MSEEESRPGVGPGAARTDALAAPATTHRTPAGSATIERGAASVDVETVRQWAASYYRNAPGYVAICSFPNTHYRHVEAADAGGIADAVAELGGGDQDVYLSAVTLDKPATGRGTEDHTRALVAVWADLDIAGPTHKKNDGLPVDLEGAHRILDAIPIPPTVVVHTGGGLQPRWVLDEPWVLDTDRDREQAKAFVVAWGRVVAEAAERVGYASDEAVFDLARVLRVPGTWNRKALWYETGGELPIDYHTYRAAQIRYTRAAIAQFFPTESQPERTATPAPALERSDGWSAAEWVNRNVSWDELVPDGSTKHHTDRNGVTYWTRPGKNPRAGHSFTTRDVPPVLVNFSDALDLPTGKLRKGEKLTKFRVYAHMHHAGDERAAARAVTERHGPPSVSDPELVDPPDELRGKPAANGSGQRRRVRLTPASTIQPKPTRWTWAGRLPVGELCLTPGRGGIGKSTFHAWLIAQITRGTLPGAYHSTPRACIIAAVEDSWERTIVPRLIAAGAKLDRVYRADVVTEDGENLTLTLPADITSLEDGIRDVGAVLLSVDPLMSAISAGLDTHKDRDVRQALEPLARLADRTGITVLGNAHFRKAAAEDPLMMAMGSVAFGNVVRAALGFARDVGDDGRPLEDGSCVITQIKNNLGRTDLPSLRYRIESSIVPTDNGPTDVGRLEMLGETNRTVDAIFSSSGKGKPSDTSALEVAVEWLDGVLADEGEEGMTRKEVIKLGRGEGHTERTLERAAEQLGVITQRDGNTRGRPSTWYHPDYPPTDLAPNPLADNPQAADQAKHSPPFDYPPKDELGGKSNPTVQTAPLVDGVCVAEGCDAPSRRACRTCPDHAPLERELSAS